MDPRFTLIAANGQPVTDSRAHDAVLDTRSGLMWSAAPLVKPSDDPEENGNQFTHAEAEEAVKSLELAGFSDWRLPNVEELFALADRSRHDPAIDPEAFPDTPSDWFWTSTPAAWSPSSGAWFVYFGLGGAGTPYRDGVACVRAVRVASPAGQ